ncbi:MAG: hypothetical protein ABI612_15760 [Betaproteobacteria bacterium]
MKHLYLTALFICALIIYTSASHRPSLHAANAHQSFASQIYAQEETRTDADLNWTAMGDVVGSSAGAAENDAFYFAVAGI